MTVYTLGALAKLTKAKLLGDPNTKVFGVADLESATNADISFLSNPRYNHLLSKTEAGAICIDEETTPLDGKNYLISKSPSVTFQIILEFFKKERLETAFSGIHETAIIHPDANIEDTVTISPYAVIDRQAIIKKGSFIGPHTYIGVGAEIGEDCYLHAHSSLREYCKLGKRVILQNGAVIGSCGFGYATSSEGIHTKLEQLGNVIIEDDVEIGANATIDRARFKTTRIGEGSKIDNLVQIGHNVTVGKHNIIAAQTGIAGSTKTGSFVWMGGQVGIVGHIEICDFVMLASRCGISKSISQSGKYNGSPATTLTDYNRIKVHQRKLNSYVKRIESLEKRLQELEASNPLLN